MAIINSHDCKNLIDASYYHNIPVSMSAVFCDSLSGLCNSGSRSNPAVRYAISVHLVVVLLTGGVVGSFRLKRQGRLPCSCVLERVHMCV